MELTRKLLASSSLTLADQRLVKVICSTAKPDRMGDVIIQAGIDLAAYRDNPVVLWGHSQDVPIARAIEIEVKDGKLQATVQFPPEGDDEDSDWVYGKIKAGIVNATSVGFIPRDYEPLDPKQPWGGFKFLKSELLEFSFVSVPANAGCLIVGRSLFNGVDIPLLPSLAKKSPPAAPDMGADDEALNGVRIPRNILEELFRQAKTPRAFRAKYLSKAAASEWKVDALTDLLIEDAQWDAPAAAKRMLDDAGFDGDSPDADKASRGFLVHDAANPTLRSSYTLPFADIIGGELKAVKAGIIAATASLPGAPVEATAGAKAIIDAYTKHFQTPEIITPPDTATTEKSGRRISSANKALLQTAMDHHASATECIKSVLDSNAAADAEDDGGDDQLEPLQLTQEDAVTKRKREAQALIASVKTKH